MNNNTNQALNWEVVEFQGNSTEVKTIQRFSDGVQFSIGDVVTNGTKMKGKITKFNFSFKDNDVFVNTDWSGIGMNLDSLSHPTLLPSKFQISDKVWFTLYTTNISSVVIAVHFYLNKVKYDLEIYEGNKPRRIYNIEESMISIKN